MNDKQKEFCEYYAECLNATEAAKKAGYSPKTAYSQGNRMLKNAEIVKYIKELQERAASVRIADITEVKETWTSLMRDEKQKTRDRIRAGELLARSSGEFLGGGAMQQENKTAEEPEQEQANQGVKIVLPVIEGETNFNSVELQNGEVVPLSGHENDDLLIYLPRQEAKHDEEF